MTGSLRGFLLALSLTAGALGAAGAADAPTMRTPLPDPDSGEELLGQPAPGWAFTRWVTPALRPEQLRGKIVLLRWWTVGCHFCETTLPEIEALRSRYGKDGFVAIGVFHPKPPRRVKDADVRRWAAERGFHGALAIDQDWETLSRYWLAGHPERNWTSVSFLLDREGRIAWVHGGGEYHRGGGTAHARCETRARELEAKIAELLKEGGAVGLR